MNCEHAPSVYQILSLGQLFFVKVHVALGRADVRMTQKPASVFDSLEAANLRATLVSSKIEHQISRQAGFVAQS